TLSPYSGPNWYVSTTGSDTYEGSETYPFRTITKAISRAAAGDTIYIAAGTYSETITIDTDNITIIGADSAGANATIINPNNKTNSAYKAITATNRTGIVIKNLQIKTAYYGIQFDTVIYSRIENVYFTDIGSHISHYTIYLNYSDSNTVTNCKFENNSGREIYMYSAKYNTISYNTSINPGYSFVQLTSFSNYNTIIGNYSSSAFYYGLYLGNSSSYNTIKENIIVNGRDDAFSALSFASGSNNNKVIGNKISNNNCKTYGTINLPQGSNNYFAQNTIDSNAGYAIKNDNAWNSNNVFEKNNIILSPYYPDSGVYTPNPSNYVINVRNNYWYTTDSSVIASKMTNIDSIYYIPFLFSEVDTDLTQDTIAPDSFSINIDTSIPLRVTLSWSTPSYTGTGSAGLAGYHIFKMASTQVINNDTNNIYAYMIDTLPASATSYTDTNVIVGETYVYKITAFDSHINNGRIFSNESWYSRSNAVNAVVQDYPSYNGPNWYVSTTGSDTYEGSETYPFRTITKAISRAAAGDTIYIAAGIYSETVVIDKDGISLIGVDSATTIIDPPGDSGITTLYGIYADTQTNLFISNLQIIDCYKGIYFKNVDSSVIENVWVDLCRGVSYGVGILLENFSDSNIIRNCFVEKNFYGFHIISSNTNTLTNNICFDNHSGFVFETNYNINLQNNKSLNNSNGILINTFKNGNIINNVCSNNYYGFFIKYSYTNNITGNTNSNNNTGFYFESSDTNNITDNSALNNNNYGFYLKSSRNNSLINNISSNNSSNGFYLEGSSNNNLINNISSENNRGFTIYFQSNNNILKNNISSNNGDNGIYIYYNSDSNQIINNTIMNNNNYAFSIESSTSVIFEKNNIITSSNPSKQNLGIYNGSYSLRFVRNYWCRGGIETTDSAIIREMISGNYANNMQYIPYRLSMIDTSVDADTIAPAAPDTVGVSVFILGCTVS
ncbi:MAG TPA: NosD domain-containing protein, partial [bacterium]|nr:NosD domain-containing protein [bacterium]